MTGRFALAAVVFAAIALGAAQAPAQLAGELLIVDTVQPEVLTATRGGALTTLQPLWPSVTYGALTTGPGDGSALMTAATQSAITRTLLLQVDTTGFSTLSSFFALPGGTAAIDLDDAGELLLLARWSMSQNGLYTAPLVGSTTLNLVAPWPKGAAEPVAMTEKLDSGDWWVLDDRGAVHLLKRSGGAVLSVVQTPGLSTLGSGGLQENPITGELLISAGNNLLRYNPATKVLNTVMALGYPQGGAEAMGLAFDPVTRGYLFTNWMGFGPGMFGFVHELDARATTIVRTTALGTPRRPVNAVAAWGRSFTAATAPTVGQTYSLKLLSALDAGQAYQAALAFTHRPGIPTPAGVIPLTPDALFQFSLAGAPIFRGFAGVLDSRGAAALHIDLPSIAALRGFRLHLAAVTLDATGIRSIVGPHGFNLR